MARHEPALSTKLIRPRSNAQDAIKKCVCERHGDPKSEILKKSPISSNELDSCKHGTLQRARFCSTVDVFASLIVDKIALPTYRFRHPLFSTKHHRPACQDDIIFKNCQRLINTVSRQPLCRIRQTHSNVSRRMCRRCGKKMLNFKFRTLGSCILKSDALSFRSATI